jgi:hypothetical protein
MRRPRGDVTFFVNGDALLRDHFSTFNAPPLQIPQKSFR